jgi:hypothetical protein
VGDPEFDGPRRPVVSDAAVRWLCVTIVVLGLIVMAVLRPELAAAAASKSAAAAGWVLFVIVLVVFLILL